MLNVSRDEYKEIEINKIRPNEYNNNIMDKRTYEILKQSIIDNGFDDPIKVYYDEKIKKYIIIDGEHRYKIMKELKEKTIPCIVKYISDEAKKRLLTLSYNKLRGREDSVKTTMIMKDLKENFNLTNEDISKITGYTSLELKLYTTKLKKKTESMIDRMKDQFYSDKHLEKKYLEIENSKDENKHKNGDVWQLGDHLLILNEPNTRGMYINLLKDLETNFCIINIPEKISNLPDTNEIIAWVNTLLKNIEFILNKNDVSLILEIDNKERRNLNGKITKDYFLHVIDGIINMGYELKDNINVLDFVQKNNNFIDMFKTIYHFSKNDIFTFNYGMSSEINKSFIDNLIPKSVKNKHVKNNLQLPYNVMVNHENIQNGYNNKLISLYTNPEEVIVELYCNNANNMISSNVLKRKYIGVTNNRIILNKIMLTWEDYSGIKPIKL